MLSLHNRSRPEETGQAQFPESTDGPVVAYLGRTAVSCGKTEPAPAR
jgi:hypothetical protein